MARKTGAQLPASVSALARVLDQYDGRYRELRAAANFGEYMTSTRKAADEEMLTEPLLASLIEDVLGFGKGDYFPQLGKSGLKPDFTPTDLVTHRFVLDAKGSSESLPAHVGQIRRYVEQRALRYGVLFNGKQMRVYPSGSGSFDKTVSFELLPLWRAARSEQLPVGPDFDAFAAFLESFSHRTLSTADKIERIRRERSWTERLEDAVVDVEFLVEQLRQLAAELARDASAQLPDLSSYIEMSRGRAERLNDELRLLALDIEPGVDIDSLPTSIEAWSHGTGTGERVWRQYLLRVAYLSVTRILLYRAWEDVGFVDEMLYDGGFDTAYERLDESVRDVLRRAFLLGSDKYKTLFHAENNYEWYRPSDDVLVDVLYRLGAIPLGKLDQDALGELYVSYVDEIDRDRLGQFFTPRDVVRFMLDRAGFVGESVFRVEGDERQPLRVFDFATGSGGFLVEAARRIIEDAGIAPDDPKGLRGVARDLERLLRGRDQPVSLLPHGDQPAAPGFAPARQDARGGCRRAAIRPGCAPHRQPRDEEQLGHRSRGPSEQRGGGGARHLRRPATRAREARQTSRPPRRWGVRPRDRQPAVRGRSEQPPALPALPHAPGVEGDLQGKDRLPLLLPAPRSGQAEAGREALRDHAGGMDERG